MKRKRIPQYVGPLTTFKKRSKVGSANKIPRTLRDFPKEMRVKLKYSYFQDFTVGSGLSPNYLAFRANSVYDPEAGIGGSVPAGFVQWSNFYTLYTVVGSTCKVRLLDQVIDGTTIGAFNSLFGIAIKDSPTPVPSPTQTSFLTDADSVYKAQSSYTPNERCSLSFNAAKYFGVKDILDNSELSGRTGNLAGANPSLQAFFLVWANQRVTGGASAQVCSIEIMLEYDVVFRQPADIA